MAAVARPGLQLAGSNARIMARTFSAAARASSISSRCATRPSPSMRLAVTGRIAFRRPYSDEAPKPRPGKLRTTFRWIWRLTYLSVLGTLGYTAYVIYDDRNPGEQFVPDPSKKTLVILGM